MSLEHEIESRKTKYYRELQKCQSQRPGENISSWLAFFFDALLRVQQQLLKKLTVRDSTDKSPREALVLEFVGNYPGCSSGQIAEKLGIPSPTVKRLLLAELVAQGSISQQGKGRATGYYLV